MIHCSETSCKLIMKVSNGCLIDHMVSVHGYTDIPCGKPDCSFIAYSQKNLNLHTATFHGHGKKPDEHGTHSCPYSSCKASFRFPFALQTHIDTHENRVFSCSYCQFRNSKKENLRNHLNVHFNIRNYVCDICSASFSMKKSLTEHNLILHSENLFECSYCGFTSQKIHVLKRHRISCEERLKHSRILWQ